ncbi:LysR substrate-binding domain-containing protein [Arthrobacter sp. D1-29]
MQLRQLEIFSVLADELHFGRAAARLRISQSALSQQLQKLEASLGAQLVFRSSRDISLTEAGTLFLEPARQTLATADRAQLLLQDHKAGRTGRIVIGSLGAGLNGPLPEIIRKFRSRSPASIIELKHFRDSASQEHAILTGALDAGILRRVVNDRSIRAVKLLDESFVVFFPNQHRLADRRMVSLSELTEENYVIWHRHFGSSFYDLIIGACHEHGFQPNIEGLGDTLEAQLALVAAGVGICIQSESHASITRLGVTSVPLDPRDLGAALWFGYRRWQDSPVVAKLIEVIDECSSRLNSTHPTP